MQNKVIAFFINTVILFLDNKSNFIHAIPLLGENVMIASDDYISIFCILKVNPANYEIRHNIWCTGILLTLNYGITAAHCFDGLDNMSVQLIIGSIDIRHGEPYPIFWWLTYKHWALLNNVTQTSNFDDIAIIRLLTTVKAELCNHQLVLPILSTVSYYELYNLGVSVVAVGWGVINDDQHSTILHQGILRIITHEQCNVLSQMIEGRIYNIPRSIFCSVANPYILLDNGDSGGPLFYGRILVGINIGNFPANNGTFHARKANIHFDIIHYRHFINQALTL